MPWALRRNNRNYPPKSHNIEKGKKWLTELMARFESLKVVVLCGDKAQKATGYFYKNYPDLCVLHAPHPSPQSMHQSGKQEHLKEDIKKTERILDVKH